MPPKDATSNELTFVITTNPNATSAADRRRVRSAAALKSWPERRKKTSAKLENAAKRQQIAVAEEGPATKTRRVEARSILPQRAELVRPQAAQFEGVSEGTANAVDTTYASFLGSETFALSCGQSQTPKLPCRCWRCHPEQSQTLMHAWRQQVVPHNRKRTADGMLKGSGVLALLTPPSPPRPEPSVSDMADPFNCYPVPYRPWFDGILHHMLTQFAPRGWPALKITNEQGLRWEWFMTQHALAEPALFYVRLLFASGELIRLKVLNPQVSFWLQAKAVEAINEALEDPTRATCDALILAVGRIALHESMYGDTHAANTIHRPAQQRMILMRGGMRALAFPELVQRLMRWADTVMTKQGGANRFLEDDETTENFTLSQSVSVLEKWVPSEGQALRKKIAISDLMND